MPDIESLVNRAADNQITPHEAKKNLFETFDREGFTDFQVRATSALRENNKQHTFTHTCLLEAFAGTNKIFGEIEAHRRNDGKLVVKYDMQSFRVKYKSSLSHLIGYAVAYCFSGI